MWLRDFEVALPRRQHSWPVAVGSGLGLGIGDGHMHLVVHGLPRPQLRLERRLPVRAPHRDLAQNPGHAEAARREARHCQRRRLALRAWVDERYMLHCI